MTDFLKQLIKQIEVNGPINIADYMSECLCHPRYGYYMTRDPFGVNGDFTTSPEISQTFGEMIGLWVAVCWQQLGMPAPFHLIELGPGRGTLMSDILRATRAIKGFHDALHIHLVELSPVLKDKQKNSLSTWAGPLSWHSQISDVPQGPFIVIANEFFDALPIRQFEKTEEGWAERFIDINKDATELRFVLKKDEAARAYMPQRLKNTTAKHGDIFEFSAVSHAIAYTLAQRLQQDKGYVLALDYGHIESGFGDTLQALRNHQFDDVLAHPADADLTAHVDFEMLHNSFKEGGACVYQVTTQSNFLENLGITQRFQQLFAKADNKQQTELLSAHRRLCAPDEMGALFKVLCASHHGAISPPAFEMKVD